MIKLSLRLLVLVALLARAGAGFAALTLDDTFGTNGVAETPVADGEDRARAVAVQPADGKVVLVGVSPQFVDPETYDFVALLRFSAAGVPDATFGTDGKLTFLPGPTPQDGGGGDGRAIQIQPADDKILVAGNWDPADGSGPQVFLARFDSAGVADPGFGTAGIALITLPGLTHTTAEALELQADGRIVVAGSAGPEGSAQGIIFRLTSLGALDPTFATGGVFTLGNPSFPGEDFGFTDLQSGPGGDLVASGGGGDLVLVKLSADGVPDAGFDGDGIAAINVRQATTVSGTGPSYDAARAIAILPDGRILVTGTSGATATADNSDVVLARVTSSGALDTTYGSGGFAPLTDQGNNEEAGGIGLRPFGDAVVAGLGFFPTQVSPEGLTRSQLSGAFSAGTADLDVLADGSLLGGGFAFKSQTESVLTAYRLNATDLADGTDTVPDPFAFTPQVSVQPGSTATSNTVTITGIAGPATISVAAGSSYSIDCSSNFVTTAGTISDGQSVCVRTTAPATNDTAKDAVLTVGGVRGIFTVVTSSSNLDPFTFVDQQGVPLATAITSAVVLITGAGASVPVSVTGGTYSIGCTRTFTSSPGAVTPGVGICVRHTSASLGGAVTDTVLTVGGISDTFSSTTIAGDARPDRFTFADQTGVDLLETITSAPVTIQGIDIASPIRITGGEYSIGCTGNFTTVAGSITNGQTLCVRHESSFDSLTGTSTTVTIGDITDVFTSTTRLGDQTPDDFSFDTQTDVSPSTVIVSSPVTISGIDSPVKLFLSGPAGNVAFARNCVEPYDGQNLQGQVFNNGDVLCVVLFSPETDLTSEVATVTLGGGTAGSQKSATFTITTGETVPDAFTFIDQVGVLLGATVFAQPVTITGITAPSRVTVTNGQWQLNCSGAYTSSAGFVANGETICVRHVAAGTLSTLTSTVLTVGGISDTFTSTTVVEKPLPGGSAMDIWTLVLLAPLLGWRRRR